MNPVISKDENVTLSMSFSKKRIADLLGTFFENRVNYWCRIVGYRKPVKNEVENPDLTTFGQAYSDWPVERLVYALALEWYFQKDVRADWSELEIEDRKDLWFKHVLRRLGIRHG